MKAIDLAKQLYPSLSKEDIISLTCPHLLHICDEVICKHRKKIVDEECIECWNQEISEERVNWLLEAKSMCN
jgi:L-ascorbate metabolism protein UlaG (beta-lactamase superfamily)